MTENVQIEKTPMVEISRPILNAGTKLTSLTGLNISGANTLSKGNMAYTASMKPAIMGVASALGKIATSGVISYKSAMLQPITHGLVSALSSYKFPGLALSMNRIAVSSIVPAINNYYAKLFATIDFSPLRRIAEEMSRLGYKIKYDQYVKVYCAVMYNAEWVPYLDFENEHKLFLTLNEIIDTSRFGSKRQIKRIDKAVLEYYTDTKIKKIKNSWKEIDLEKHYKKMISQAVDAYFRKEYILTISCLVPLWETLIFKRKSKERHNTKVIIEKFKELASSSGNDNITDWLIEFFETLIMGQCNGPDEVKEDLPARHGTAHGWWKKYPSKKSALNAILLTDFILKLDSYEIYDSQ